MSLNWQRPGSTCKGSCSVPISWPHQQHMLGLENSRLPTHHFRWGSPLCGPNCRQPTLSAIPQSKFTVFGSLCSPESGAGDSRQSNLARNSLRKAAPGPRILAPANAEPSRKADSPKACCGWEVDSGISNRSDYGKVQKRLCLALRRSVVQVPLLLLCDSVRAWGVRNLPCVFLGR